MRKFLITTMLLAAAPFWASAQRYCNPLPMEIGTGGNAAGDVTVLEEGGKYYRTSQLILKNIQLIDC